MAGAALRSAGNGAVTHLASAGIQVLYDFVEQMTAEGRTLRFVVPPGCPAGYAIRLSDLHRVSEVVDADS